MLSIIVNGKSLPVDVEPDAPLHWVLRDEPHLNATRLSCGIGEYKKNKRLFSKIQWYWTDVDTAIAPAVATALC